ncbi:MAG: dipeptide epimerase [Chitinophagaceae bacterium]|nr:dipeptide epimerase [Chitinophagaceae bacterium]
MTITSISIYRLSIPMVPFTIATGTMNFAQNLFIRIHTNLGLTGVGECSAFPMIAGETQDTCFVLAKDFAGLWKGKDASEIEDRLQELDWFIAGNHTVKSAFDMALLDLAAKAKEVPLYEYLGGHYFEPESDITIGIDTAEKMAHRAKELVNHRQVKYLKIKLGKKPEDDIKRLFSIKEAVGSGIKLRIDANQGWDYEGAVMALTAMEDLDIEFCEQPLHKRFDEKMPALRRISKVPLMADESVFDHYDAEKLIRLKACDYINIKLSKAGGIMEALKIHDVCAHAEIPNMLGGMLESRLALSAKVHLALACPNIHFYDLDTCLLGHKEDPVINGVVFENMKLKTPKIPGIGADIDDAWLEKCEKVHV